jgi:hypothetical protein
VLLRERDHGVVHGADDLGHAVVVERVVRVARRVVAVVPKKAVSVIITAR